MAISEALRTEQRVDQVAEQQRRDDAGQQIVHGAVLQAIAGGDEPPAAEERGGGGGEVGEVEEHLSGPQVSGSGRSRPGHSSGRGVRKS
jgi:hypothetical protein